MRATTFNTGETEAELRERYNPEGSLLRSAQQRMMQMMDYLDSVCREQGIDYQINSGCVIGALRHEGFIPWDDDIDIMVPRHDYKRLCDYLKAHPHPQFVLQDHRTDPRYYGFWSVLRDLKSEYVQDRIDHNVRKYRGLQIDIFPFDCGTIHGLQKLASSLCSVLVVRPLRRKWWCISTPGYHLLSSIVFPLFRLISRGINGRRHWSHAYGQPWHTHYPDHVLFPSRDILFEGRQLMGPADPVGYCDHAYSTIRYTDLPPVETRYPHQAEYKIWD